MTAPSPDPLLDAVRRGVRMVELGHPFVTGMPCSPNHPGFRMTLLRRHGDLVRPDGGSGANELIITGGHVGTHIDALSHISQDGRLHGGVSAHEAVRGGVFAEHGAEHLPGLLAPAVLLDVAAVHGVGTLPGGHGVTAADLDAAAARAGAQPGPGEVALVRTGWARHYGDPAAYLGEHTGVPGVTEDGARWLAARQVVAAGADTTAFERIPAGAGHRVLPVHRILLVESGIHIIEHLALEDIAATGVTTFVLLLAPLRIVGGTGSPIRPMAVLPAR